MELTTPRLILRPARAVDVEAVHALWTDPEIRRFLFDDRCLSQDEVRVLLDGSEATFREQGYGVWLAFAEGSAAPRGFAGLLASSGGPPNLVVGLEPASWGQGLAAEAARAVLHHAFSTLGFREVAADVDEPNTRSIGMLERLGMRFLAYGIVNGRPLRYYRMTNASSATPGTGTHP